MTNNARVGGILTIISGAFGVLGLVCSLFMALFMRFLFTMPQPIYGQPFPPELINIMTAIYVAPGIICFLIGVLGIVGGIFALKRRHWGLALAGAIAGSITFFACGIPAIIFVTLGKPEFSARKPARPRRR